MTVSKSPEDSFCYGRDSQVTFVTTAHNPNKRLESAVWTTQSAKLRHGIFHITFHYFARYDTPPVATPSSSILHSSAIGRNDCSSDLCFDAVLVSWHSRSSYNPEKQ